MTIKPIHLDGSYKEGGGQIVRTALALSAVTQKPFEVAGIRKGRPKPGLKSQHLHCIKALEKLCNARAEGAELGSEMVRFSPGKARPQNLDIDIGTAGSITLFLQSLMLPCMLAEGKTGIKVRGGTDTKWSMPIDYFSEVLLPQLRRYAGIDFTLEKRGYYPKGGGSVALRINPLFTPGKEKGAPELRIMEQAGVVHIKGVSHASASLERARVAERQAESAAAALKEAGCPVDIRTEYCNTSSDGSGITLWGVLSRDKDEIDLNNPIRVGADSLGERGKKAEVVGREAATRLLRAIKAGAPVDRHLADNLIPIMGIFGGSIRAAEITGHTLTNIYVTEKFLDVKFRVDENERVINADAG